MIFSISFEIRKADYDNPDHDARDDSNRKPWDRIMLPKQVKRIREVRMPMASFPG